MDGKKNYIGYVRYTGKRVEDGAFDARKSAKALLGFDEALRHFISAQAPELRGIDFEIPVRIEKGSWIASIPNEIGTLFQLGLGVVATAYVTKAAQKMAEKDFDGVGFKDIFRVSIEAIKWIAKIGKHLGGLLQRKFENVKFLDDNELIGIPNEKGEYLYVPKKYFDLYVGCSPKILDKLAANIDEGLTLSIGVVTEGTVEEEVVTVEDKPIFTDVEDKPSEDVLFPELVHGDSVVLEGEVTRENKSSHSMGFKYMDHILTAYPQSGNIVPYKPMLFIYCRLIGVVDRIDETGRVGANRPKLIFSHLEPMEEKNGDLFDA